MTYANQIRLLTLNIQSLASVIGQGLIAAVLPGIQALNALMSKLMQAAETFRNFMYVLMGKKVKGSTSGVVNDLAGLEDSAADLSGLQDAGDAAASGMDDATSSAKALKKALSVLPFDELNQLTDNSSSSGSTPSTGTKKTGTGTTPSLGLGGITDQIDDALNKEETPINKWAEKIRKAFLNHDWKGLGKTIADMINIGIQKIYDVISWKNAGPKITAFTGAFTETFNSLVDNIDWNLMGRTIGAGLNTIVNTMNQILDGIDWYNLGAKFGDGITGIVKEVDWTNLGNLIGNSFRKTWDIFAGLVNHLPYSDIGEAFANLLNGVFEKINFTNIVHVLAVGLNGAFTSLESFTLNFKWDSLVNNITGGITTFLQQFKWKENGQKLEEFMDHFLTSLVDIANGVDWEAFGHNIGVFLSEIDWSKHLSQIATVLSEVLGGIWKGLGTTSAGLFVETIIGFGIASKLLPIVSQIGGIFLTGSTTGKIQSSVAKAFSGAIGLFKKGGAVYDAFFSAAGTLSGALSSLTGLSIPVGAAAAGMVAAVVGIGVAIADLWKTSESFRNTVGNAFSKIKNSAIDAFGKVKDTISPLVETFKNLGSQIYDFYSNSGLKSVVSLFATLVTTIGGTVISTALDIIGTAFSGMISVFRDGVGILSSVLEVLNGLFTLDFDKIVTGFSNLATNIVSAFSDINNTFVGIGGNLISGLLNGVIDAAKDIAGWFKENVVDKIVNAVKNLFGIHSPSTVFAEIGGYLMSGLKQGISDRIGSVIDTFTNIKNTVTGVWDSINTKTKTAWDSIGSKIKGAWDTITGQTETNSASAATSAEKSFSRVSTSATKNWGNSSREVTKNVRQMKIDASTELGRMDTTVRSHFGSQYNIALGKWKNMGRDISSYIRGTMDTSIGGAIGGIVNTISRNFSDMYSIGQTAMQNLRNGMESINIRTPHISMDYTDWQDGKTHKWRYNSKVDWYAKGGLFNAASVIGVGEAGKEAVLPLTNKQAMKSIADSITGNMPDGSVGLSKEEMTQAVTQGVAMAMMNMNTGGSSSPQYISNTINLDGRAIAKAVTKAQNDNNRRKNPSPAW